METTAYNKMNDYEEKKIDTNDIREMYLDLLKRSLCNLIYPDNELRIIYAQKCVEDKQPLDANVMMNIRNCLKKEFQELCNCRLEGHRTVSQYSHSMIGLKRMDNIQMCAQKIFDENIPGDFVETGVWRGGAAIFMRALLKIYGQKNRLVWAADSFRGLPTSQLDQDKGYDFSKIVSLAVDIETVKENFSIYDLLDDKIKFIEGWFEDTLPKAPIEKISLLRLDGDLYKSTFDAIWALYDKVATGGYIIVDDYGDLEPCRQAIDEFRAERGISDSMISIDWTGVYWRKQSELNSLETITSVSELNNKGETLFQDSHIEEAATFFIKAISIDSEDRRAHNNLGVLSWHKGEIPHALECFIKAYEIDPGHRQTILNLIDVLTKLNQIDEARLIGNTYLQQNPDDQDVAQRISGN